MFECIDSFNSQSIATDGHGNVDPAVRCHSFPITVVMSSEVAWLGVSLVLAAVLQGWTALRRQPRPHQGATG